MNSCLGSKSIKGLALTLVVAILASALTMRASSAQLVKSGATADKSDDKSGKKKDKEKKKGKSKSGAESAEAPAPVVTPAALAAAASLETVTATVETDPVPNGGDAADDPAIWVNPADPAQSVIIGTDKRGGLAVYNLSGKQIQYLSDGLMDNVDLRDGFKLDGRIVFYGDASNRKKHSIVSYIYTS